MPERISLSCRDGAAGEKETGYYAVVSRLLMALSNR